MFPTFLVSTSIAVPAIGLIKLIFSTGTISIYGNQKFIDNCKIIENAEEWVLISANKGLESILVDINVNNLNVIDLLKSNYNKFRQGFILSIYKSTSKLELYNDCFGIYPVFYFTKKNKILISNDFLFLTEYSEKKFNKYAILDYFLFNYALKDRTLLTDINQLPGGHVITIINNRINVRHFFDSLKYIVTPCENLTSINDAKKALGRVLQEDISDNLPVELALTGGFDTKVVLSLLLEQGRKFNSFTFGQKNSKDNICSTQIAEKFHFSHKLLPVDQSHINSIEKYAVDFIKLTGSNPALPTLINYCLVKDMITPANILTGVMGGELIAGPIVISEVIITRTAQILTTTGNKKKLKELILNEIEQITFLEKEFFRDHLDDYIDSLSEYLPTKTPFINANLLGFLIYETYGRFFGTVYRVLMPKFNMINPFMELDFLNFVLNSKYSFLKNKSFTKNPFFHSRSRKIYAKLVKEAYPEVLDVQLDRGYKLRDIQDNYLLPIALLYYIKNHYFARSVREKRNYPDELESLNNYANDKLIHSDVFKWDFINKSALLSVIKHNEVSGNSPYIQCRLILLQGLNILSMELNSNKN